VTGIPLLRKNRLTKTIKTMKKLLLLLFAAALSLSASEPARAWGREGHETIAKIAERNLTTGMILMSGSRSTTTNCGAHWRRKPKKLVTEVWTTS
jgi:hypothetical protein